MFAASKTAAVSSAANYIEDVFSTYLYKGNSSTQTITNGIDLSGKGGLTWIKVRDFTYNHYLYDTARGVSDALFSNSTSAQSSSSNFSSFDSSGFTLNSSGGLNNSSYTYASWTFRKQPKFFDVVTYTGNGSGTGVSISHALGSVPGVVMVKCTSTTGDWRVLETSTQSTLNLNATTASPAFSKVNKFGNYSSYIAPTSTTVYVNDDINTSGQTYVMYLFASNAGGFGLTGTDNVISCGSFTTDGSGVATVNLGYEPQFLIYRKRDSVDDWHTNDTMRGWPVQNPQANLSPNLSDAESNQSYGVVPSATGINVSGYFPSTTVIYIAIRRGPMKVPTSGTSVFAPFASSAASGTTLTTNFPVDSAWFDFRGGDTNNATVLDRLRGTPQTSTDTAANLFLRTSGTAAETTTTVAGFQWWNTGINIGPYYGGYSTAYWMFRRAPSFFDEVCYTGTSSATTQAHNLGVVPELMIVKRRDGASGFYWGVYAAPLGATKYLALNTTIAAATSTGLWNNTTPTSSVFSLGTNNDVNLSAATYVAYLFATCAGVSKVGSYTGNGTTQTINCGFTGGARFVLIKRTDSTGDWYVYDTARGMTVLTDPYLLLNSTAAESATLGSVTTVSTGFAVNASILAAINTNAASYIFLAIA